MPSDGVGPLLEEVRRSGVARTAVNEVHFREAFWRSRRRMDVRRTKVLGELQRLLDRQVRKVLFPERHNLVLRYEARELVLAGVVELAELHATYFGADVGGHLLDCCSGEEVWERRVRVFAMLNGFEGHGRRVFLVSVIRKEFSKGGLADVRRRLTTLSQ